MANIKLKFPDMQNIGKYYQNLGKNKSIETNPEIIGL